MFSFSSGINLGASEHRRPFRTLNDGSSLAGRSTGVPFFSEAAILSVSLTEDANVMLPRLVWLGPMPLCKSSKGPN